MTKSYFNFWGRFDKRIVSLCNTKKNFFRSLCVMLVIFLSGMGSQNVLAGVSINSTEFPDATLRALAKTYDSNSNNFLDDGELKKLAELTKIDVGNKKVSNLKGIEYFTGITQLYCSKNSLTSLDLRKNTKLKLLKCNNNKLTSLNISGITTITTLNCDTNSLSSLDVSKLTSLTNLQCRNNKLTSLDVSKNTNLDKLYCGTNSNLKTLTLGSISKITVMSCSSCALTSLNVNYLTSLTELICFGNSGLTTISNLAKCTNLTRLNARNCALTSLNLSGLSKLRYVLCHDNKLTSLTLPTTSVLEHLQCQNNSLTSLDITKQTKLLWFTCGYNKITSIDPTKCTKVWYFACHGNQISTIDLSKNTVLRHLSVHTNKLKVLAIPSGCKTTMTGLYCHDNQLTELNLTGFTKLYNSDDSIKLGPQKTSIRVSSLSNRSIIGIKCNSNNGTLANYGSYTAQTISSNNYIILAAAGTTGDKNYYKKTITYNYTTGYTGSKGKTMEVNISTSAYVMYVNPKAKKDSYYYGTIYLDYNSETPSGSKIYYANGITTDGRAQMKLYSSATTTILPAKTAFYVEGTNSSGYYPFYESTETATAVSGNKLSGTLTNLTVPARSVLTLGHEKTTNELYFWTYTGTSIPNHRAYVSAATLATLPKSAQAKGLALSFDDETTAINNAVEATKPETDDNWYTLQGIRLSGKPTTKGIYVINGKKVAIP